MNIKKYVFNCFLLTIPVLLWDYMFTDNLYFNIPYKRGLYFLVVIIFLIFHIQSLRDY